MSTIFNKFYDTIRSVKESITSPSSNINFNSELKLSNRYSISSLRTTIESYKSNIKKSCEKDDEWVRINREERERRIRDEEESIERRRREIEQEEERIRVNKEERERRIRDEEESIERRGGEIEQEKESIRVYREEREKRIRDEEESIERRRREIEQEEERIRRSQEDRNKIESDERDFEYRRSINGEYQSVNIGNRSINCSYQQTIPYHEIKPYQEIMVRHTGQYITLNNEFRTLPQNNHLRRPILLELKRGVDKNFFTEFFGISETEHYFESEFQKVLDIFDEVLPFFSGKDFRMQYITNFEIYSRMEKLCDPILQEHIRIYPIQRRMFQDDKTRVLTDDSRESMVLVMDFSQLNTQGDFRQDLIVCIYRCHETKTLNSYHLVADKTQKNEVNFVIGSICLLFNKFQLLDVVNVPDEATKAHLTPSKPKVKTISGIKTYHKFIISNNRAKAFIDSANDQFQWFDFELDEIISLIKQDVMINQIVPHQLQQFVHNQQTLPRGIQLVDLNQQVRPSSKRQLTEQEIEDLDQRRKRFKGAKSKNKKVKNRPSNWDQRTKRRFKGMKLLRQQQELQADPENEWRIIMQDIFNIQQQAEIIPVLDENLQNQFLVSTLFR
eukprot:gene9933-12181_t